MNLLVFKFLFVFFIILPSCEFATLNCTCGHVRPTRVKRVTGGYEAPKGSFPFFAALVKYVEPNDFKIPFCGGALISNFYVLTVGHCIFNKTKENVRVLLDFYDFNDFDQKKHSYEIDKFIVHPDYFDDLKHPKQDIGLIKLKNEVKFNDNILPICLPDKKPVNDNDTFYGHLTIPGWGRTHKSGELPEQLQMVKMFQDVDSCSLVFGEKILEKHICLKDTRKIKTGWKDVCKDWIENNTKDSNFCNNFI